MKNILRAAALLCLWSSVAANAQQADPDKPESQLLSLTGAPRTLRVEPSGGVLIDSVALLLPPGRRHVSPKLSLDYSSAGGNGDFGRGWRMDLGSIELWRGSGTPSVGNPDRYSFSMGGVAGELINTGGGVYRVKYESIYREFTHPSADTFVMVDGQGGTFTFKRLSNIGSAVAGPWLVTQAKDPSGNTVNYSYKPGNFIASSGAYQTPEILKIQYTGFAGTGDLGSNSVDFVWETRPDKRLSWSRGLAEERTERVKSIEVRAQGALVRRYDLTYSSSPQQGAGLGESLLTAITLVGKDGSTSMPLRTIEYTDRSASLGWSNYAPLGTFTDALISPNGTDSGQRLIDVNGDGYPDQVQADGNGSKVLKVKLGYGEGIFFNPSSGMPDWSARLADVIYDNRGSSLDPAGTWFMANDGNGNRVDGGLRLLDINGDGLPDALISVPRGGYPNNYRQQVWLHNGAGWTYDATWSASLAAASAAIAGDPAYGAGVVFTDGYGNPTGVTFADVNGDGWVDLVKSLTVNCNGTHEYRNVFLNTGSGFQNSPVLTSALSAVGVPALAQVNWNQFLTICTTISSVNDNGVSFMDLNGDGLSDIVQTADGLNKQQALIATGSGWTLDSRYTTSMRTATIPSGQPNAGNLALISTDGSKSHGLMSTDYDGDGLVDYVRVECNYHSYGSSYGCTNPSVAEVWKNTGSGFARNDSLSTQMYDMSSYYGASFVTGAGLAGGVEFVDIDADGISDLYFGNSQSDMRIVFGSGGAGTFSLTRVASPVISKATTALGEVVTVFYASTSQQLSGSVLGAGGQIGPFRLPQSMTVVQGLTRTDGRSNSARMSFIYEKGIYSQAQFQGFGRVDVSANSTTPSWVPGYETLTLSQSAGLIGQVVNHTTEGPGGSKKEHLEGWQTVSGGGGVTQLRLVTLDDVLTDPGKTPRHSRETRSYDAWLNTTTSVHQSDVGIDSSSTTTYTLEPRFSTTAGPIWSRVTQVSTSGSDGVQTLSRVEYDNGTAASTRGLPVRAVDSLLDGSSATTERQLQYDTYGNVVSATDRTGHSTDFAYDSTGAFRISATDALGHVTQTTYDPGWGVELTRTAPTGNRSTRTYDTFGRLIRETLPGDERSLFGTRTFVYSALSGATPDPQSVRVLQTTVAGSDTVVGTTSFVDAFGQVYRTERDSADGAPPTVELVERDYLGLELSKSNAFVKGTQPVMQVTARDGLGRPVTVTAPDLGQVRFEFGGRVTVATDRRGNESVYVNDGAGKLLEVRQHVGTRDEVTRYSYDSNGRLASITDALGAVTRIAYDGMGRRTRLEDPSTGVWTYQYDGEGRLTAATAPDQKTTQLEYDAAGHLAAKHFSDGTLVRFTYGEPGSGNGAGHLVRVVDAAGTLELSYDVRGQVTDRRRTIGAGLPGAGTTYVTSRAYDAVGRQARVMYPDGYTVMNGYDTSGQLTSVVDTTGHAVVQGLRRSASGQLTRIGFGNGVTASMGYDNLLRLTSIASSDAKNKKLQALSYRFDPDGNVTSIVDTLAAATQNFQYDEVGRLTQARGAWGEEQYDYDSAGNLVRKGDWGFALDPAQPQHVTCAVDLAHPPSLTELTRPSLAGCRDVVRRSPSAERQEALPGSSASAYSLEYDARGNLSRKGELNYEYDEENHLVRVRKAGELLEENIYDSTGARVLQITPHGTVVEIDGLYEDHLGANRALRHVFAGSLLVATLETARAELVSGASASTEGHSGLGCAATPGALNLFFLVLALGWLSRRRWSAGYEVGKRALQRPVVTTVALLTAVGVFFQAAPAHALTEQPRLQKWHYYHSDYLGSAGLITDSTGAVEARREYRPWGDLSSYVGKPELRTSFEGKSYEASTGLYHFGARHYDAELGRFTSADTHVPDPKDPRSLLRYAFAADNPLRFKDPTGHDFFSIFISVLVVVAVVVLVAVTFGAGAALFVVAAAVVGALVGLGVGLAKGKSGSDLAAMVMVGAVLGALVAAAIVTLFVTGGTGAVIISGILQGAASGAITEFAAGVKSGQTPDQMLNGMLKGAGIGAAVGLFAGAASAAVPAAANVIFALGVIDFLVQYSFAVFTGATYDTFGNLYNAFKSIPPPSNGLLGGGMLGGRSADGLSARDEEMSFSLNLLPAAM